MPLYRHPDIERLAQQTDLHIHTWRVTETEQELAALLPPDRQYAAEAGRRFLSSTRRKGWLAVRVLLHRAFGPQAELAYRTNGKPYLHTAPNDTSVSISHSGAYACLAIGRKPVGIDIERHGPKALRLCEKFLSPQELPLLGSAEAEAHAVTLWSAKEAAYKYVDIVRKDLRTDIGITTFSDDGIDASATTSGAGRQQLRVLYRVLPDFVMTLCTGLPPSSSAPKAMSI